MCQRQRSQPSGKTADENGKGVVLEDEGNDFAMIYEGSTTDLAMRSFEAYREKGKKGKLINIFSVKPVDRE